MSELHNSKITTSNQIRYDCYPTARKFHLDTTSFIRVMLGPVGGGKTVACIMEIFSKAITQAPFNGIRQSRWAVVRQTYPELKNTTLKTWKEWIPESLCHINMQPPFSGYIKQKLTDGTEVECEVIFLALDTPDDVQKLKSIEFTGVYINEVRYCDETIFQTCKERVGRYPMMRPEYGFDGASWNGIIADTNAWSTSHWLYDMFDKGETPEGHKLYEQPPAIFWQSDGKGEGHWEVNPDAENLSRLKPDYYSRQLIGGKDDILRVELGLERGMSRQGKPVFPQFSEKYHVSPKKLEPRRGMPVILGFDWGLNPACVIAQLMPMGVLHILDVLSPADEALDQFTDNYVVPLLHKKYAGFKFQGVGDPSGRNRSGITAESPIMFMRTRGINATLASTNNFIPRKEAVDWFLDRHKLLISPELTILRDGLGGGYVYPELKGQKGFNKERPDKHNPYSHSIDALQYICLYVKQGSGAMKPRTESKPEKKFKYA